MKKLIFIIAAVLGISLPGIAKKTLEIVYQNDTIKVLLKDNGETTKKYLKDMINAEIDSISIIENDSLQEAVPHKLLIGTEELKTSNGKTPILKKDLFFKLKKSITIQDNDVLKAYRGNSLMPEVTFVKSLSASEFKNALNVKPLNQDSNDHVILEPENSSLKFSIENPDNIKIDSVNLYDASNNKISAIAYADSVSKEVSFPNFKFPKDQDTISVTLAFTSPDVSDNEIKLDRHFTIVKKNNTTGSSTPIGGINWKSLMIILIIALVLVIALLAFIIIYKKRKGPIIVSQPNSTPIPTGKDDVGGNGKSPEDPDGPGKNPPQDPKGIIDHPKISSPTDEIITPEQQISSLKRKLEDAKNQLKKTRDELSNKNNELTRAETTIADKDRRIEENENKISSLNVQISNQSASISSLQKFRHKNEELIKENKRLINEKRDFDDLKAKNQRLIDKNKGQEEEIKEKDKQIQSLNSQLISANNSKAAKEDQINSLNADKNRLEQYLREEKNKTSDLKHRLDSFSKQTHYLYLIDEALSNIERRLPMAFGNVTDETMRRKLVDPIVIGTPGLDETGMESYKAEWRNEVFNNQPQFFGKDVQLLSDDEVMETLRENFIENLAMRDSFNKLVRLYLFSNVGWLNVKLVEVGFDVDTIQTMFSELKNLFDRFGVEISYPRLFIDKFDETKHRDSHRCIIFTLFEPTPEVVALASAKDGESLIVDLVRIGLPRSKTSTRRIPMVSLPNF